MEKITIDKELVAHIAEALDEYSKQNDNKVLNRDVVNALQYVTACVERVAIPDKELN